MTFRTEKSQHHDARLGHFGHYETEIASLMMCFFCIFLNPLNVICNDRFSYELHIFLRRSPELVQQTKHIPVLYVPVFSKLKSSDVLIIH